MSEAKEAKELKDLKESKDPKDQKESKEPKDHKEKEPRMTALYLRASSASSSNPGVQHLVTETCSLIVNGSECNIMAAANRGSHHAVLAICHTDLMTRLESSNRSKSLLEMLNTELAPFDVAVVPVRTLLDLVSEVPGASNFEAIVAKWK